MINRTTGWIQDPGSLEKLIKVIEIFNNKTKVYKEALLNVRKKIKNQNLRKNLIKELFSKSGLKGNPIITYRSLVGSRTNHKTVDSILQALLPGQNRLGIVDWACDNFIRFAHTLDFIEYFKNIDSYSITKFGLLLSSSSTQNQKYETLESALLQYPPVTRILELLYSEYKNKPTEPLLTKFELGRELGFKGEDGFTNYPLHLVIQEVATNPSNANKVFSNWEGSSDKYARMICGWLMDPNINWVKQASKKISVNIAGEKYETKIPQSYLITTSGINALKRSRAVSRHSKIPKRIYYEMLATKGSDVNYLRTRRAFIVKALKTWRSIGEIQIYLKRSGLDNIPESTIFDDIFNFTRIGLDIRKNNLSKYKVADEIIGLSVPIVSTPELLPSEITKLKQNLSISIKHVPHDYFDIIDLGFNSRLNRLYEIRIVDLLSLILKASHLPGGNKPEIGAYYPSPNPKYGIIIDSKAYNSGFNLPNSERDKMIRYLNEYVNKRKSMNPNKWWEFFKDITYPSQPIIYAFVSGQFVGQFLKQLLYIKSQTGHNGSAITSEILIRKVNDVLDSSNNYNVVDLFVDFSNNALAS